jgi:hypothetical protein
MTASKSYDMFSGNKKRDVKHTTEKDELQEKINELEMNLENGGNPTDESNEEIEIRDKLLEILGERN